MKLLQRKTGHVNGRDTNARRGQVTKRQKRLTKSDMAQVNSGCTQPPNTLKVTRTGHRFTGN